MRGATALLIVIAVPAGSTLRREAIVDGRAHPEGMRPTHIQSANQRSVAFGDDWVQTSAGIDTELFDPLRPEVLDLLKELNLTKSELYKGAGLWEDQSIAVDLVALGIDEPQLDALKREVLARVRSERVPMLGLLLFKDGELACSVAAGEAAPGQPLAPTSLLRFYSMTKPICSFAALMLHEAGKLDLDAKVSDLLPCWDDAALRVLSSVGALGAVEPAERPITVRMLLTHTSGLTYGFLSSSDAIARLYREKGLELPHPLSEHIEQVEPPPRSLYDWAARMNGVPLASQPGSKFEYGHSTDLLGAVLEHVCGEPLGELLSKHIFEPLKMQDTRFSLSPSSLNRLATCYRATAPGEWRRAAYHTYAIDATDERTPWLEGHAQGNVPSGGAGLISTAADYARFAQCLTNGGEFEGVRLLSEATLRHAVSDQLGPMGAQQTGIVEAAYDGFGLIGGVVTERTMSSGPPRSHLPAGAASGRGTVAWGGAAGTYFFSDPANGLTCVIYTQLLDYGIGAPDLRPALCRSACRLFPELRAKLDDFDDACLEAQGFTG